MTDGVMVCLKFVLQLERWNMEHEENRNLYLELLN